MSYLNRAQILAAQDRKYGEVPVPEWGGSVRIRTLTAGERGGLARVAKGMDKDGDGLEFKVATCAAVMCDEAGEPLFTPSQVEELRGRSAIALDRVFAAAMALSKVDPAEQEARAKN